VKSILELLKVEIRMLLPFQRILKVVNTFHSKMEWYSRWNNKWCDSKGIHYKRE